MGAGPRRRGTTSSSAHLQVIHVFAARRAGGGRTVPVLVTADGRGAPRVLGHPALGGHAGGAGAALCIPTARSAPTAAAFEHRLDEGFGPGPPRTYWTLPAVE